MNDTQGVPEAAPPLALDMTAKLHQWFATGERGVSSETMAWWLAGQGYPRLGPSEPHDPADFRRCELLLRAVPELRDRLANMAHLSPEWSALVQRWDEIVATCEREVPGIFETTSPQGRAPEAYQLIRACRESAAA